MTTDSLIGALKRFMGRRGYCKEIFCDNATNFVGAHNKLKELEGVLLSKVSQEKIANSCAQHCTQINFIPPESPHFGGLWEAAVKSFKTLFLKTFVSSALTYEELCTATIEIEAMLNSRPLTPMSSDPNDLSALTPGHFLIGEPLTMLPEKQGNNLSSCSRWKLVNSMRLEFWRRWSVEYLCELQVRNKWAKNQENIKLNSMVVIKDRHTAPLKWPVGRIVKVITGADGLVRVVEIMTASGVFKRAIHNICVLPIETEETIKRKSCESQEVTKKRNRLK